MKKHILGMVGIICLPNICHAELIGKFLGTCNNIQSGNLDYSIDVNKLSILQTICSSPTTMSCGSAGYSVCGSGYHVLAIPIGHGNTGETQLSVICVPENINTTTNATCKAMLNGCPSEYMGSGNYTVYVDSYTYSDSVKLHNGDFFRCCVTCYNIDSAGSWTYVGAGYETRPGKSCDSSGMCATAGTEYRCVAGYYKQSGAPSISNTAPVCYPCPRDASLTSLSNPATSISGATAASQCYVPAGVSVTDATGVYEYTQSCYYQ